MKKEDENVEKDFESNSILDNKYNICRKIGQGSFAKVYLVLDKNYKEKYAAKILLQNENVSQVEKENFFKEGKILQKIKEASNINITQNVIKYYESGTGDIKNEEDKILSSNRHYLISEYLSKGNLTKYLNKTNGFKEKYAKIIFSKILKGIQFIHELDICHLDIKPDNVLLDSRYNPIITDFGLSTEMNKIDKNEYLKIKHDCIKGTPYFICPEMNAGKDYYGIKADIFSLGVVLLYLVSNKNGFTLAKRNSNSYKLIINKKEHENFWKSFANNETSLLNLSKEFKDLYLKLVAYSPNNRPNSVKDIFDDPWLKEVNTFTENDYKEYEDIMKSLEDEIKQDNETLENSNNENNKITGFRADNSDYQVYFDYNLKPNYIYKTGLNAMNYIKIKGDLDPVDFMNSLANKIKNEFDCEINENPNKLKFEAVFKNKLNEMMDEDIEEKEEEDEEEEKEEIRDIEQFEFKDCKINIKLFESINGGYEVHFVKTQGDFMDYYQYFQDIKKIIKILLKTEN